ncbi:hypothetical protein [Bradyrhizobium sp.]|uniref:hypothetical protein n=1 Tax=Bradyrhizobium sp. TaxID=376 RepID=UPI0025C20E5A|nr:hypothetical protein [Bradyrhizobium sp.]MBV8919582.1 hypothetical protein [Bradyrhizobium sp.]
MKTVPREVEMRAGLGKSLKKVRRRAACRGRRGRTLREAMPDEPLYGGVARAGLPRATGRAA